MKIGIVFAGQGAQYTGMGKDLCEAYPEAQRIFDLAGEQVKTWCFEGDEATLRETHITQPTIYTTTMAAYEALLAEIRAQGLEEELEVLALAGFSLGEYSALTAAGAIDFEQGIGIVTKRGTLMKEAGQDAEGNNMGAMAAALTTRDKVLAVVEMAREDGILEGVNFNSPKQTVVAGDKAAIERFIRIGEENKVRAVPLSVSTAFHSPMMVPAAEKLREVLKEAELKAPQQTVYSDVTADDIMAGCEGDPAEHLAEMLARQAMSPVYWEEITGRFAENGAQAIIEVGPGHTLTGLTKKTVKGIAALNVENVETLEQTIMKLKELAGK